MIRVQKLCYVEKARPVSRAGGDAGSDTGMSNIKQNFPRQAKKTELDLPIKRKTWLLLSENVMVKSIFGEDEPNVSTYES